MAAAVAAAAARAALAAQLILDQHDLNDILNNVCFLTQPQMDTLIGDGYDTARSLVHWDHKAIRTWCEGKAKLAINRGGCTWGDRKIKCLQALAYWCTEQHLKGEPLDAILYDDYMQDESIVDSEVNYNESKKDKALDKPGKFSHDKWQEWEEAIYNYFGSYTNSRGIPYEYVIRKDPNPIDPSMRERDNIVIYNATLVGSMFKRDSKHVLQILRELTNGTQAETWMKKKTCGRLAMIALQDHYDGKAEGERRMAVAKADLTKLFYRNEATFSFEKYVTKLLGIFNILEKYKFPVYAKDKVDYLLDKINCPDKDFQMAVNICRSRFTNDFVNASIFLQTEVARIFPESQPSSGRYNKRRYVKAFGRGNGGRGGGRGRGRTGGRGGRGGRGRGNNNMASKENGIDISDPTRWYEKEELNALSRETRNYILQHPDRKRAIEERKKNRDGRRETSTVNSAADAEAERGLLVTAMINAQRNAASTNTATIYPQNGSSRNRNTSSSSRGGPPSNVSVGASDASAITFDHLGNIVD